MPTATLAGRDLPLTVPAELVGAIVVSVNKALSMCDIAARCVGISTVPPAETGNVTGLIGVHGKVSGFVTLNVGERLAIKAVEGLLQEQFSGLTSQVVDGVGEITNIVGGGIKGELAGTDWAFPQLTIPSVIVGRGYQFAYARGLEFVSVMFEHQDPKAVLVHDRLMHVSISLLTR